VRARWPSHVVRRALYDVMSGLQPSWPDSESERVLNADHRRVQVAVDARNACELYTQRLTDLIGSKVMIRSNFRCLCFLSTVETEKERLLYSMESVQKQSVYI